VTKTIEGNTMIGPNAQDLDIKYKYDEDRNATTNEGLNEVLEAASRLIPNLPEAMAITNFAGLRATSNTGDFIIRSYKNVTGFINVAGIKSPGLTAAPAIAELVIGILKDEGLELKQKKEFDPIREKPIRFVDLSPEAKNALIAKDSTYGLIVCRCEHVTEGEIVTATKRGAHTMDGIKYRTRCGMGRCQGGFCGPRVAAILARELSIPFEQVTKDGDGSNLVVGKTKSVVKQKLNV